MTEKQEKDADDAYVIDDETLEELDGASLSSLVSDLTNTMKRPQIDPAELGDDLEDADEDGPEDARASGA